MVTVCDHTVEIDQNGIIHCDFVETSAQRKSLVQYIFLNLIFNLVQSISSQCHY